MERRGQRLQVRLAAEADHALGEIAVEAVDSLGHAVMDRVVLEPFVVTEAADVASVLLEASVQDKRGRFVRGIDAGAFSAAQCEAARAAFPWPLRWIEDASESTRQWLDTLDADAVLIRPDRYVAGVARGGDALRNLTASVGAALGVAEAPVAA